MESLAKKKYRVKIKKRNGKKWRKFPISFSLLFLPSIFLGIKFQVQQKLLSNVGGDGEEAAVAGFTVDDND